MPQECKPQAQHDWPAELMPPSGRMKAEQGYAGISLRGISARRAL